MLFRVSKIPRKSYYSPNAYILFQEESLKSRERLMKQRKMISIRILKIFGIFFSGIGGILLALKVTVSPYGFAFMALSSLSILISAVLEKDRLMIFYGATLFFGVDLLGVYRWIIMV